MTWEQNKMKCLESFVSESLERFQAEGPGSHLSAGPGYNLMRHAKRGLLAPKSAEDIDAAMALELLDDETSGRVWHRFLRLAALGAFKFQEPIQ